MLLNEDYKIKKESKVAKTGNVYTIAYIDNKTSSSLFGKNDILKKYGAKADTTKKPWVWFWFLGETPEEQDKVINTKIKPCLVELNSNIGENGSSDSEEIIKAVEKIISKINNSEVAQPEEQVEGEITFDTKKDIISKLENFKRELVNSMSDESFKAKFEPIIKFRNAQGHKYSLVNSILIWIQDPNATLVKSRSNWLAVNKEIKPNARAISLWVINSFDRSKDEKDKITNDYLKSLGKEAISQLSIYQREELKLLLRDVRTISFTLVPRFFDISQTKQIDDKEDIVGSAEVEGVEWYVEGMEDERASLIYSSLLEFAKEKNIKVETTDGLDGARGQASASGTITILNNSGKDIGLTKTLAHEISHELLHFSYASSNDSSLKSHFIGTKEGRGVVEQQAEVCAWIVMKNFKFDLKTSINYIGLWGADEKSVVKVFDQVAKTASILIEYVEGKMKTVKLESIEEDQKITGLDVAKLLGFEDLYLKSKEMNEIRESFFRKLKSIEK